MAVFGFSLEGKPPYYGLIIGVLVGGALFWAAKWRYFDPMKDEIASKEAELSRLEDKISEGRAAKAKLPEFREEVRLLELQLERLLRILPAGYKTPELLRRIRTLLEQGDLDLLLFDPEKVVEKDFYYEWPINVRLEGGYHNLALFFDRVSRFPRIVNVDKLTIQADRQQAPNRTINASFVAKTFVYKERATLDELDLEGNGAAGGSDGGGAGGGAAEDNLEDSL